MIRIFRACAELNIRNVAIYSKEESSSYHRFKVEEAYLIGEGKTPINAYLEIEGVIEVAKRVGVDAIHPGYGFLSSNGEAIQSGDLLIEVSKEHILVSNKDSLCN